MVKHYIKIDGNSYTFNQLSDKYGIKRNTIYFRFQKGWRGRDLIKDADSSKNSRKTIHFKGKETTFEDLAEATGLSRSLLQGRYYAGSRDDDLVRPVRKVNPYQKAVQDNMLKDPEFAPLIDKIRKGTSVSDFSPKERETYDRGYHRYLARIYRHRPDKVESRRKYYKDYYHNRGGKEIRQRKPEDGDYPSNWAKYFHKYYIEHPDKVKANTDRWLRKKKTNQDTSKND